MKSLSLIVLLINFIGYTSPQFLFGHPNLFVTSNDTDATYDPFQLIYDGNRFFKLSEYVQIGISDVTRFHIVYVDTENLLDFSIALTVEDMREATISQNLQKELFFSHYNLSGVYPQMRIINTTYVSTVPFYANEQYPISYYADYMIEFDTLLMVPPYDIIIEVPGFSSTIKTFRTLVDVQSFAFQRFQISVDPLVTYDAVVKNAEAILPTIIKGNRLTWRLLESSMKIISNPCIQDYFLLSMRVGRGSADGMNGTAFPIHTYIQVPGHYTSGNDGYWTNITAIYCPNPSYAEECGEPEEMILTNRHFLMLSSKGLLVSNDLIVSSVRLTERFNSQPLARFDFVDPCQSIIKCFSTLINPIEENLVFTRKLHYTAFCDILQYPNNDDIVIFVLEHTDKGKYRYQRDNKTEIGPLKTFSVTFSARPYKHWRRLFLRQEMFDDRYIMEIVGIFYNLHLERFDITMKLSPPADSSHRNDVTGKYVRFILPLPVDEPYYSEGYPNLSGSWGQSKGFIVQNFSESFIMNGVAVNPGTMDVIFYGSEMHIAESGRAIVYQAIGGYMNDHDSITGCYFNHPDRFYVCMMSKKLSILIGRVATWYGPVEVDLGHLGQVQELIDVIFAVSKKVDSQEPKHDMTHPQEDVLKYIFERAFFTTSYSGNIIIWYFSDPKYFYEKILEHDEVCKISKTCAHYPFPPRPKMSFNKTESGGQLSCKDIPCILPVPLDPLKFKIRNTPTSGPLVPFLVDAETILLYEAFIPGKAHNDENYLSQVCIGQKIFCMKIYDVTRAWLREVEQAPYECELYFRHIKLVLRKDAEGDNPVMPGFRSVTYLTVIKPIPMSVIEDMFRVQMAEDSNRVRIICLSSHSSEEASECKHLNETDIGVTVYIPGEFSIMIQGGDWQMKNALIGVATYKTVLPLELFVKSKTAFKMSMRTEKHYKGQVVENLKKRPHFPPTSKYACHPNSPPPCEPWNVTYGSHHKIHDWEIGDGGCQFEMTLVENSYIRSSGGKIDLDLQESVSFEVELRPLNALGRKMLYRPLMVVTQSNPEILHVLSKFNRFSDRQTISVLLKPTGVKQGVSSFVIRSIVSSISCKSQSSFTYIVQCVRAEGRRLEVQYPKTENVTEQEMMEPKKAVYLKPGVELYTVLPVNYRPPSVRGISIPMTKNVYNADPSKPLYNSWYKVSNESAEFKNCKLQTTREGCACTRDQKMSDDPLYSDCKEKVYAVKREENVVISLTYPPRQAHEDQLPEFFSPPPNITVKIEEINGRVDYTIGNANKTSLRIVEVINKDEVLHMDDAYYSATNLTFRLHGTGLYHFKATLGRFHTFDDVSTHIILYSVSKELDDVMLVMLVILTMTLCFVLIFFGFLRVRHSLVAQLPIRVMPDKVA